jgi:hypothetical protein
MEPRIDPELVMPAVAAIAMGMVIVPVAGMRYLEARKPLSVPCPQIGEDVVVRIDPKRAVLALVKETQQRVIGCSRWPKYQDCDRGCERLLVLES